jgi:hypothetical protein
MKTVSVARPPVAVMKVSAKIIMSSTTVLSHAHQNCECMRVKLRVRATSANLRSMECP